MRSARDPIRALTTWIAAQASARVGLLSTAIEGGPDLLVCLLGAIRAALTGLGPMRQFPTVRAWSLCLALFALGCSAERPRDCGAVPKAIFAHSCLFSTCHNAIDVGGRLDLESEGVEARLVGVPAAGKECTGHGTLVLPGNADQSLLWRKLRPDPPCGSTMPYTQSPLSDSDAECILQWIQQYASDAG